MEVSSWEKPDYPRLPMPQILGEARLPSTPYAILRDVHCFQLHMPTDWREVRLLSILHEVFIMEMQPN